MFSEFPLSSLFQAEKQLAESALRCNETTRHYGLTLTPGQAQKLVQARTQALRDTNRVEFEGTILNRLILAFCDSPYLSPYQYAETLEQLVEIFYYFKNELPDKFTDDELLSSMRSSFDGDCCGSVELLAERDLEELAKAIRFGEEEPESSSNQWRDAWNTEAERMENDE